MGFRNNKYLHKKVLVMWQFISNSLMNRKSLFSQISASIPTKPFMILTGLYSTKYLIIFMVLARLF